MKSANLRSDLLPNPFTSTDTLRASYTSPLSPTKRPWKKLPIEYHLFFAIQIEGFDPLPYLIGKHFGTHLCGNGICREGDNAPHEPCKTVLYSVHSFIKGVGVPVLTALVQEAATLDMRAIGETHSCWVKIDDLAYHFRWVMNPMG